MRCSCRKYGFTFVETLVVISLITVLVAMTIGVGKHVKEQGRIKLTESTIEILVTAVELYYEDEGKMPFETVGETPVGSGNIGPYPPGEPYLYTDFELHFGPASKVELRINTGSHDDDDWSSEVLYYYLNKNLNSKRVVDSINDEQVTSRDAAGDVLNIDVAINPGPSEILVIDDRDMPRFVDAWGNTIRYRYTPGETFCRIISPGKDKLYGTPDDISNKRSGP